MNGERVPPQHPQPLFQESAVQVSCNIIQKSTVDIRRRSLGRVRLEGVCYGKKITAIHHDHTVTRSPMVHYGMWIMRMKGLRLARSAGPVLMCTGPYIRLGRTYMHG